MFSSLQDVSYVPSGQDPFVRLSQTLRVWLHSCAPPEQIHEALPPKTARNQKSPLPVELELGIWNFSGAWMLNFGVLIAGLIRADVGQAGSIGVELKHAGRSLCLSTCNLRGKLWRNLYTTQRPTKNGRISLGHRTMSRLAPPSASCERWSQKTYGMSSYFG